MPMWVRGCVDAGVDMISDNDPMVSKYISIPKELNQLNCAAFIAGIVEAILDGCQFVSPPPFSRPTQFSWCI